MRKQRNAGDYEGDPVSGKALSTCLSEAARLLDTTRAWLASEHLDLAE